MSRRPAGDAIDVHVGKRVRERRVQLGMSQKILAKSVGVSFQQIQKNERGTNRIGASRMFELSKVLDVPVSFFFDDMNESVQSASPLAVARGSVGLAEEAPGFDSDPMARRETLELVRAYYSITDPQVRKRVYELAKALAGTAEGKK